MQQWQLESGSTTFEEVSMKRSKTFVKALQELKNLRPQLYSAAEYCEKSYLHNEQKQMILDNLKSYAVQALVNAVDHLGTVAYKLTNLFEQQIIDVSTVEMKITCLHQQASSCQAYGNKEGLSQHQMSTKTTRHHKHYILPHSIRVNSQNSSQIGANVNASPIQGQVYSHAPGKSVSKTLSWHLASESNTAPNGHPNTEPCYVDARTPKLNSEVFHLLVADEHAASPFLSSSVGASSNTIPELGSNKFGLMDLSEASNPISAFKYINSPGKRQTIRSPVQSKSMLSAFFTKNKTLKLRKVSVS